MSDLLDKAWPSMLGYIKKQVSPQSYETWFAPTRQVGCAANSITIEVPNKFFRDWLLEHYRDQIAAAAKDCGQPYLNVEFSVSAHTPAPAEHKDAEKRGLGFLTRTFEKLTQPAEITFNSKYTFESFVVGGCNRFAHAASLAVADSPAKAYNPLFIYGGVGLGKTHLMQAIGQHALKKYPRLKILYISSEKFTNQLIGSIQNRTMQKFKERYRQQDLLLIDDIHFISGKESTQEEFFHTFNTLYDAHKQIVVSSDRAPKEIPALENRLVSRFEWGLVTDIQPPDLETRVAILRKKLEKEVVSVPDEALFFIADAVRSNIRELEGALIRVIAYSSLIGQKIDANMAREVLKDMTSDIPAGDIGVEKIQRVVADYFGISITDMRAKKRTQKVVYPRQIAMYIAREMTKLSLNEIGGLFGGKDHATIIHACEKIGEDIKKDVRLGSVVSGLVTQIRARG